MVLPTPQQLDQLLAFLSALEMGSHTFGADHGLEKHPDGSFSAPWVDYPPGVIRFFELASLPCFSDYEYADKNPGTWLDTPNFIQSASLEQCITLLTFFNRSERFSEGSWRYALENGIIQDILRRLGVLRHFS